MESADTNAENSGCLVAVWRFRVRSGKISEFVKDYGPGGAWEKLFRRGRGYVSTELLRDASDPTVFITIDRWKSRIDYDTFRREFADDYLALDTRCAAYTEDEELLLEGADT